MVKRSLTRNAFGKQLSKQGLIVKHISDSRNEIDQSRLLTLQTAAMMDTVGNLRARQQISMVKIYFILFLFYFFFVFLFFVLKQNKRHK